MYVRTYVLPFLFKDSKLVTSYISDITRLQPLITPYNPLQPLTTSYKRLTRRNSELSRVRVITQLAYLLNPLSQRYNFYKSGKGPRHKKLAKS